VYNEYVVTSRNYIRSCTQVRPEWLLEIAPHYFNPEVIENEMTRGLLARHWRGIKM